MQTALLRSIPARLSLLLALAAALVLSPAGCSGDGSGTTTGGEMEAGDGKFHPEGNGVAMNEADACDALTNAQSARRQFLGCAGTSRTCPEFLRAQFTTQCLQYDQGSVQGCIDYYDDKKNCDDLSKGINDCAVSPLAGTAPKGCP